MVQILQIVWFDTNHRGYTPMGSIPFARTLYRVNPLNPTRYAQNRQKGIFKSVRKTQQFDCSNSVKALHDLLFI